jgi:hypothetical protein
MTDHAQSPMTGDAQPQMTDKLIRGEVRDMVQA